MRVEKKYIYVVSSGKEILEKTGGSVGRRRRPVWWKTQNKFRQAFGFRKSRPGWWLRGWGRESQRICVGPSGEKELI